MPSKVACRLQYGEEEVENPETQGMQGMQEETTPKPATTAEERGTLPETVPNPRKDTKMESEKCRMETEMG